MTDVRGARLFVLAGPDLGRSFPLGERTTLGRSDECDLVLRDRSISRKHAVLVHADGSWFVEDLGSTNGVSKDGKRGERIELADGDEFRLGDLALRLRLGVEGPAPVVDADIEFDLGPTRVVPAPAVAPAPLPVPAPPSARAPAARDTAARDTAARGPLPKDPDEIEVEEEIEIEGPDQALPAAVRAAPMPLTPRAPRAERRTGFFAGDLSQQPFWLRTLIVLGLIAFCAGLAYGAFRAVAMLRGGL
jgi:predicted component of type VI protein secretion system